MFGKSVFLPAARVMVIALLLLVSGAAPVSAAVRDRMPPTAPANFRVTAKTSFSVSLAWSASTDNSGNFTYRLWSTAGPTVTLPKTATSYTWNTNIAPRNSYTFGLYAVDAAGNASKQVTLSVTTPADTTAPTAPALSVTEVGSTFVSLAWTGAQDDGPFLFYRVFVNGSFFQNVGTNTSYTVHLLKAETDYTFNVQAYDYGPNSSPLSNTVEVTTLPVNTDDTTPPTTPANLTEDHWGDGEIHLRWEQSTDNVDAQANIRYDIFINGALDHSVVGTGFTITYGVIGNNTVEVVAVDTAGNRSEPARITIVI